MLTPVAVIFDMDGLLVDSEPLWRDAEIALFAEVGVVLDHDMCRQTMGLRIDEAVDHWYVRFPWTSPTPKVMVERIVDRVAELVVRDGTLRPGVEHALDLCAGSSLRVAIASSSIRRLIEVVLDHFDLRNRFEVVHSAEDEPWGKPHPGIFLTTAHQLGVDPVSCTALEDSVNGVIAAKAARMRCIAVPEHEDARFVLADVVLGSLTDLRREHLE